VATPGRPPKLTAELIDALAFNVELLDGSLAAGARASGVSARSVRRWQERGRRELAALSPEAQLVLALGRAEREAKARSWEVAAEQLEALAPERWAPPDL
jgi:hypothetical protein